MALWIVPKAICARPLVYDLPMLETIRRYWIGGLVIVLVGIHASIVGVIRHQASLAKVDASCEVDLGQYLGFQLGKKNPLQMRLHAIVPMNHRMKSRQLIELNRAQIRQSLEEHLRQLDSKLLTDPYLSDLKSQLMDVLVQTIGQSSIDDLVVTEVRESSDGASLAFVSQGHSHTPRRLVASLRDPSQEEDPEEELTDADHSEVASEESHGAHAGSDSKGHAATKSEKPKDAHGTPKKATSHAAPAATPHGTKKPAASGHGTSAKTPAASGHGATAKKPAADAKKSGH